MSLTIWHQKDSFDGKWNPVFLLRTEGDMAKTQSCISGYVMWCPLDRIRFLGGENVIIDDISDDISRPTPASPDLGDAGANSNPSPDTPKQVS